MTIADQAPALTSSDAQRLAADLWGLTAPTVRDLGSHQDRNVLITSAGARYVLKVANAATPGPALDAQNEAMLDLVASPCDAGPHPRRSGALREVVELGAPSTACGCSGSSRAGR